MADTVRIDGDGSHMGVIRSAFELVSSFDPTHVPDEELSTAVLHVERLVNAVHAVSAILLERFEHDGRWAADGAVSAAAWVAARTGSSRAGLRGRRREGAALAHLPGLATLARDGRLSTEHLRAIGDCVHRHPQLAAEHEDLWVEHAEALGAEGFRAAARHWLAAADDNRPGDNVEAEEAAATAASRLHASRTLDGWMCLRYGEPTRPAEAGCDAAAYRVALTAAGEVLDVGRQTNRWPAAIRRAITVRDRGCTFPGCDRPPAWADIHHCTPWAEGGDTSVENGVLLCRRHHTFVHRQHWRITVEGGRPTTRRPDGTRCTVTRWQPDVEAS